MHSGPSGAQTLTFMFKAGSVTLYDKYEQSPFRAPPVPCEHRDAHVDCQCLSRMARRAQALGEAQEGGMSERWGRSAKRLTGLAIGLVLAVPGVAWGGAATASQGAANSSNGQTPACPGRPSAGYAVCHAVQLDNPAAWNGQHVGGQSPGANASTPSGYSPVDLRSAYSLAIASSTDGTNETVAIVDAYNDPNAYNDLSTYRRTFSLPSCLNTGTSPCFRQVNQNGGTSLPRGNYGWGEEISLDLDMVSAVCPNCHILLVEASSNSFTNLAAAEDYARSQTSAPTFPVVAISNSYGGSEFSSEASYDSHYTSAKAAITVSTGDSGYGVEYPAASPDVTAVGGTTLSGSGSSWSETAWSGAGSGCSSYEAQPLSQSTVLSITGVCAKRALADVSADANPNTGVSVYDTYREPGWMVFGGTSVASPVVASVYALAGNTASGSVASAGLPYSHGSSLHDILTGSNGSCGGSALCTATTGWDGPTGLGSPNGIGAF